MTTAVIGRVLATSLYQAITEQLPLRVEFYESWLSAKGFTARRVYVAGVRAVFSFLRHEGGAYDAVMRRAGDLAAGWLFDELPPIRRRLMLALPRTLRARAALALAASFVKQTWGQSQVKVRWRRGAGTLTITPSLFCDLRDAAPGDWCGFYAAGVEACLRRLNLEAEVRIDRCAGRGGGGACTLAVETPRAAVPVAAVVLAMAAALTAGLAPEAAAQTPAAAASARVLVMPFDNATGQARLSWMGEGASILLAEQLDRLGVDAMGRDERAHAFERLQVPGRASLSRASVIRIGELVGAVDVVIGSFALDGDTLELRARRIALGTGQFAPETLVRGALAATPELFGALAAKLWPAEGGVPGTPVPAAVPMAAFEPFVRGLLAGAPATQVPLFMKAIQIAPDFVDARIALARAHAAAGDDREAIEALAAVGESSPRWVEARVLTAVAQLGLHEAQAAWHTLTAVHARAPSALVLNNLGVVRLRLPAAPPGAARATWYFSQARTLDPLEPDYLFNLGYAYWLDGDPTGAGYWLREAVRLNPTDASAHALLAQVLHAGGHAAEAASELALAQRLSAAFEGLDLNRVSPSPPRGLERLKEEVEPPRAQRIDAALEMVGHRQQRDLARFYLERARRLVEQENDRGAEQELTRALYLSPYDAEAHLLLGQCYLRTGRLRDAIDQFKVSIWSEDTAAARVALAEAYLEARDGEAALAEAQQALTLDPASVHARQLVERLRREGAARL